MKPLDLVRVADLWEENQEYLKQRLGQSHSTRFGARWVTMPETPYPRFNHVSRIRVQQEAVGPLVAESRAFFREQRVPNSCLLVTPATLPSDLGNQLYRLGFTAEINPVMIWDGTPVRWTNPAVEVLRAPRSQVEQVFELIRRVFFPSANEATLAMGRRGVETSYDVGAHNYIAYCEGRPVGAGMLFCWGGMGGIYNMCTLPEFRGRGVARAIMAACLSDARALHCEHVGLTPTAMGRPLYEQLGFRELYQERYFVERV